MSDTKPELFADCWSEKELADQRDLTPRSLRAERQRGEGPPYIKDARRIYYPISEARVWLAKKMCSPAREPQTPKAVPALKPRVTRSTPAVTRRRVL